MTVYTVSVCLGGSDQCLEGVFSTREKADAYAMELIAAGSLPAVEEWQTDSLCGHRMRDAFACSVDASGEIKHQWSYRVVVADDEPDSTDQFCRLFTGRSINGAERAEELAREALRRFKNPSADLAQKENGPDGESVSC